MFGEKLTYKMYLEEFQPKIRALFDHNGVGLHEDIAPFWELFKTNTLNFYDSKMVLEDGKHSVSDIRHEMFFNIRWSIEQDLKRAFSSVNRNYEKVLQQIDQRLLGMYPLLQKDQEMKMFLEGFIREHRRLLLQNGIAEAFQSWGRRGYITTKWKKKGDCVGGYLAGSEAEKVLKAFEKKMVDKISEVEKHLRNTNGSSTTSTTSSSPIQVIQEQRALLLRTLQNI